MIAKLIGYESIYSVSVNGIITRNVIKYKNHDKTVAQFTLNNGYKAITVRDKGNKKNLTVHYCVLASFTYDGHKDNLVVMHKDGNKLNNNLENLQWGTVRDNHLDKKNHGTFQTGELHGSHKLTNEEVLFCRDKSNSHLTYAELGRKFNVTGECISYAVNKGWRSLQASSRMEGKNVM